MRLLLLPALALAATAQTVDPDPPMSPSRRARIEELRKKAAAVASRFEAHTFTGSDGQLMPYRLFRPAKLDPARRYPLVLYLHGAGGLGADNKKQYTGGNLFGSHVWALEENQAKHPAFILAPQTDQGWGYRGALRSGEPEPEAMAPGAKLAFELLEKILAELPIDRMRIYVTGQSMGGAGSWYMAMQRPDRFAAAVPVCGGGNTAKAGALRSLPIWNFHGAADTTVPVKFSRAMIDAVRAAGGKPLHTEYEGVGHNSWEWAYTEPALPGWLFAQHK